MAKRRVRVTAVQREQVDIDMLVSGLLLLLEELADESTHDGTSPTDQKEANG
jgi:hypothetical protein